ncbi:DUF4199 domain-containing protein [Pedobacter polaris]|uniref:DUF4199 domain-containing protein n=1 Tax=Pedobacter polaris TaxID=2571273 RepID=A0A4U1CPP6_9SPHI|nr:DUF4199 domain-containing protein [Pedobacter polaris]TKC10031.1 DUF4199 domain-containing protein [Pedobacter polaris]
MKKNILIFGLIAGLIISTMMAVSAIKCYEQKDFEGSMVLGFTTMIIAFSVIFVAVKNYRDKFNNGVISFGKAFKIGILITLIGSTLYVATWLVVYYNFVPNFMEVMSADSIEKIKLNKDLTASEANEQIAGINSMKEMYKNPVMVILLTYMEVFPIGLIITLISALLLKRKQNKNISVA